MMSKKSTETFNFNIQSQTSNNYSPIENNIVDIKNFYVNYLITILKPSLIDGLITLYNDVVNIKNKNNLSVIDLFKESLKNIKFLKQNQITALVIKIKDNTQSTELLDKTIKAVVKSFIILLTFNNSNKTVKLLNEEYHEKINTNEFIYRCYVEFSQSIYYNIDVFLKYVKLNLYTEEINNIVYSSIETSLFKMLPMGEIMDYYLSYQIKEKDDNETLKKLTKFIISTLIKNNSDNSDKIINQIKDIIKDLKINQNKNLDNKNIIVEQSPKINQNLNISNELKNIMSTGTFENNDLLN